MGVERIARESPRSDTRYGAVTLSSLEKGQVEEVSLNTTLPIPTVAPNLSGENKDSEGLLMPEPHAP